MKTRLPSAFSLQPSAFALLSAGKRHSAFGIRHSALSLAALLFCLTAPPAQAQDPNVTINAAEFHRLVYSGHVLTEMANKPELDAVFQTLLEVQRHNPQADPALLASVLQEALARFRTNAPVYLRSSEPRDEILGVYLEAFQATPAHTSFHPATLALLNVLMGRPGENPPTGVSPATLLHSSNQGFICAEDDLTKRQALVDECTRRALVDSNFRQATDLLMSTEGGVRFEDTSEHIITNNPALSANPAMLALLHLSQSTPGGGIQVTLGQIDTLLTNELQILHGTIETNRQVHLQILQAQQDLMAYLADTNLVNAMADYEAACKDPQTNLIFASHASLNALSALLETHDATRGRYTRALGNCMTKLSTTVRNWGIDTKLEAINKWNATLRFSSVSKAMAGANVALAVAQLVIGFSTPSPEEIMMQEIRKVKDMIYAVGTDMHNRFDQVDRSLNSIQTKLDSTLVLLNETALDVEQTRQGVLDVQMDLHRLERQLFTGLQEEQRVALKTAINGALYYENSHPTPMPWATYNQYPNGPENTFYTYANDQANSSTFSPYGFTTNEMDDAHLKDQLSLPLNGNLNYVKEVLYDRTGQSVFTPTVPGLANPQDWFVSSYAYLQVAMENPLHFRTMGVNRLDPMLTHGQKLTNFFRSLTFGASGTNINWPVYDMLTNNYSARLANFVTEVHATEQQYAWDHLSHFPLDTWRDWAINAPRVSAATTGITPVPLYVQKASRIAGGRYQTLALRADGTVLAWGNNAHGERNVPSSATNVVALATGDGQCLALRGDGRIVGWGANGFGEATGGGALTNVSAIGAGLYHSLAVRSGGQVVGWGWNPMGQITIPPRATNAVAVAGGYMHSLALLSNGAVIGWGFNGVGQITIPSTASNGVVAIAAGYDHSLALRADGRVVGWGNNVEGEVNIPSSANSGVVAIAAGWFHSLALKNDGTVVAWGDNSVGQTTLPSNLSGIVAIAAGQYHSVALKADGTVIAWGSNAFGQSAVPGSPPGGAVAVAASKDHSLALKADGTVVAWGKNDYGQCNVPAGLTNVVAIAAGSDSDTGTAGGHSLAVKADGTVVAWGKNVGGTIPAGLTNVVAAAASENQASSPMDGAITADGLYVLWEGGIVYTNSFPTNLVAIAFTWTHTVALTGEGEVLAWGENDAGQCNVPAEAKSDVVAIAAGGWIEVSFLPYRGHTLALKSNGKIICWGDNNFGQCNLPQDWNHDVVAIAASPFHSLALRSDGSVFAWGQNDSGQCNVPPEAASGVVAIAAGGYLDWFNQRGHSLAVKADGTVIAWGHNAAGQINVPASLQRYESFAQCLAPGDVATDSGSRALDGQLISGPTWTNGVAGYALAFDGVNDYVRTSIPAMASNYTVSAWVFLRGGGEYWGSRVGVLSARSCNSSTELLIHNLQDSSPPQYLHLGRCGAYDGTPSTAVVPTNQWAHVAVTVDSSKQVSYFINGIPAGSWNAGTFNVMIGPNITLGDNGVRTFKGILDEVQIWSKACTPQEIASNMTNQLSGTESNLVAHWRFDDGPPLRDITQVAAGLDHTLVLRSDGKVQGWGVNNVEQCQAPRNLTGVKAIAAGDYHSLALKTNGSVAAWGWNRYGQTGVPVSAQSGVLDIAAGGLHSLVLKTDGTVTCWGCNARGQTNVPPWLDQVVAIAAGGAHNLALKADGTVVSWGWNTFGQTNVPPWLDNVVAVAAGARHSLALRYPGEVVGWGWNAHGETNVPPAATSNVVAIAALKNHSLALKSDGTVVAWGDTTYGQTTLPTGLRNVVSVAAGGRHNVFLTADTNNAAESGNAVTFVLPEIPSGVVDRFRTVDADMIVELGGRLRDKAVELSGAKALLQAVLELGMSYTLERDDVLHGFFYGTEGLPDLEIAGSIFAAETNRLASSPDARPMVLEEVVGARYTALASRLNDRLLDLQATGQPEIPRIVGHTLRLLNLLREAHGGGVASSPPPALEIWSETNSPRLLLYGEPYAHYNLQYSPGLSAPAWSTVVNNNLQFQTNVHNGEIVAPPASGPVRLYRAVLPAP